MKKVRIERIYLTATHDVVCKELGLNWSYREASDVFVSTVKHKLILRAIMLNSHIPMVWIRVGNKCITTGMLRKFIRTAIGARADEVFLPKTIRIE